MNKRIDQNDFYYEWYCLVVIILKWLIHVTIVYIQKIFNMVQNDNQLHIKILRVFKNFLDDVNMHFLISSLYITSISCETLFKWGHANFEVITWISSGFYDYVK